MLAAQDQKRTSRSRGLDCTRGWASIKNGRLLRLAEATFDVFITVDRNMQYQQNLGTYKIAVVVLTARRNRFETLQPLIPSLLDALKTIQLGDLVRVRA